MGFPSGLVYSGNGANGACREHCYLVKQVASEDISSASGRTVSWLHVPNRTNSPTQATSKLSSSRLNLKQDMGLAQIEKLVDEIVAKNPDKVGDAKTNPKAIGWFVGQVMKASGGKANPQAVNDLLKKRLGI